MKVLCGSTGIFPCHDFSTPGATPEVETIYFSPGESWERKLNTNEFVFVINGELQISFNLVVGKIMDEGKILSLSQGCRLKARTDSGVSLVIVRPGTNIHFCKPVYITTQSNYKEQKYNGPVWLEAVPPIRHFLTSLINSMKNGLVCSQYMKIKIQELFILLQAYYSKEQLSGFLQPFFNKHSVFAKFVWENYKNVKTVNEFASLYSCSVSNFDKKFQRVFGIPVYKWMMKRKTELIFHEITMTEKTFSVIAKEHGFPSNSQFTDYCKKHLGKAPTKLRKEYNTNCDD